MRQNLLRKMPIILLGLLALFFGYNLILFSQNYSNEVFSINQFNVEILEVSKRSENELFVKLNLSNPSVKDIKIITVLCNLYYEDKLIAQRYIDFSFEPLILKAQSATTYETTVTVNKITLHKGIQVHLEAKATIETTFFGLRTKSAEVDYLVTY